MNVQITDINETRKTLTVTLDKGEVDGEYNTILGEFTKQVSLPGFRPGKAPAAMVAKRFGKELKDEFKQKVIGKAYRDGRLISIGGGADEIMLGIICKLEGTLPGKQA